MVSPRKTIPPANLSAEEFSSSTTGAVAKLTPSNTKSSDSLYSAPSSRASASLIYRRKFPTKFANRQPTMIPATSDIQKRVMSARRLRFKNVQNQLGLAQQTIQELTKELKVLRQMHKRQNSALSKYESTNAELPRLLHSHAEELRVWQTKYRQLQISFKDMEQKLKQKEAAILTLSDENKYYCQLNKNKNLEDRQRLAEKLQSLETRLQEKESQMKLADRRAHLEIKNLKQQLSNEQKKTKDVMQKLEKTKMALSSYQKLEELNISEKMTTMTLKQGGSKTDIKSSTSKKPSKEKPFGGSTTANSNSKTPSPLLEGRAAAVAAAPAGAAASATARAAAGAAAGAAASAAAGAAASATAGPDEDDSDFPISHRSQRSTASSLADYSTTRTVRKMSLSSMSQRNQQKQQQCLDTVSKTSITTIETIGDGPDVGSKSRRTERKRSQCKPKKMMVDMPNFVDDTDCDGDTTLIGDEDAETVMNEKIADDSGSEVQSVDFKNLHEFLNDNDNGNGNDNDNDDDNDNDNDDGLSRRYSDGDFDSDNDDEADETNSNGKEDILSLRKKITDDYKDREAFLDTFCRQASTSTSAAQRKSDEGNNNAADTESRKYKLLAALKAIDDDQCSDN